MAELTVLPVGPSAVRTIAPTLMDAVASALLEIAQHHYHRVHVLNGDGGIECVVMGGRRAVHLYPFGIRHWVPWDLKPKWAFGHTIEEAYAELPEGAANPVLHAWA
jgi:hypothetical protein